MERVIPTLGGERSARNILPEHSTNVSWMIFVNDLSELRSPERDSYVPGRTFLLRIDVMMAVNPMPMVSPIPSANRFATSPSPKLGPCCVSDGIVHSQNSIGWSRMAPRGVIAIQRPQWGLCGRCLCRRDQCEARSTACPLRAQTGTQLRLGAAPCGFLAGIPRLFGVFGNVANVDVAGSNPVSCSRFRRPGHDLRGRGDALSVHVAPWRSRGRTR